MDTYKYFKHARTLGNFTATDCLFIARQAAALDHASALKRIQLPVVVWYEVNPDGTHAKFSQGVTVY
jgi:hypothetical protein